MPDFLDDFNNSATDNLSLSLERKVLRLDTQDKIDLWNDQVELHQREREEHDDDLRSKHLETIVHFSNQNNGQPMLELGTERLKTPIRRDEVVNMIQRAERQGFSIDQMAPANAREQHILVGIGRTLAFEERQREALRAQQLEISHRFVDGLLGLRQDELPERKEAARSRSDDDGPWKPRDVSSEFDRRR